MHRSEIKSELGPPIHLSTAHPQPFTTDLLNLCATTWETAYQEPIIKTNMINTSSGDMSETTLEIKYFVL
ncbi:MAG: hypothetical protein AT708_03465 [Pyrobaculum sp. OCT_11]|nr:MAG: hypothetical protein AT708_03465 [Pyrobaculum sp. OCT_11]